MFICNQQIPTSYICTVELVDKFIKNKTPAKAFTPPAETKMAEGQAGL